MIIMMTPTFTLSENVIQTQSQFTQLLKIVFHEDVCFHSTQGHRKVLRRQSIGGGGKPLFVNNGLPPPPHALFAHNLPTPLIPHQRNQPLCRNIFIQTIIAITEIIFSLQYCNVKWRKLVRSTKTSVEQ